MIQNGKLYTQSAISVSLPAVQGNNVFKIKAVDIANNESNIVTETIFVDSVPPIKPNLMPPTERIAII